MASRKKRLTAAQVERLKEPGVYHDEHGLRLRVYSSGNRCWEQQLTIKSRRTTRGVGGYPVVSLKMARDRALQNLRDIWADGARGGTGTSAPPRRPDVPTLTEAEQTVREQRESGWTNDKEAQIWKSSFERFVLPTLGNRLISEVTPEDLVEVLSPIWIDKNDTAKKLRSRISAVMRWAQAKGYRADNPAGETLAALLPRMKRVPRHYPALRHRDVGAAVAAVRGSEAYPTTKLAFEFLVLTAARSGEVRGATWGEIDFKEPMWTVSAERMKAREEHRVPLCARAVALVEEAREWGDGGKLVFASKTGRMLSNATMSKLLRELGMAAVPHGFRSSFRDWCGETEVAGEVAEACLAHVIGDKVEVAYARSDLFKRRRKVMDDWSEYLNQTSELLAANPSGGDVQGARERSVARTKQSYRRSKRKGAEPVVEQLARIFHEGRSFGFLRRSGGCIGQFPTEEQ